LETYAGDILEESVEPKAEAIALTQKSSSQSSITSYKGGATSDERSSDKTEESSFAEKQTFIDAKDLTGKRGLERVMDFIDSKNPPQKGSFEYKKWLLDKDEKIFSREKIGKYSSKINSICKNIVSDDGTVAEGIILIYSQYIDGGLIPIALALEEMGFSRFGEGVSPLFKTPPTDPVDSKTLKPRKNKKDSFTQAKYIMITGDKRLSPNNDYEIKAVTNDDNKDGYKIKIVLISQAGSEGVDFKFLRQVHIIDPWYNMNRIEQIIGRGVRNFSHKNLPFEKRNVELFIYGTILERNEEESADLYVYRLAEFKAIQMGRVSRVLKETAVDCLINHDQTNFTQENIAKNTTEKVKQILSDGTVLNDFKVGDIPYSAACDYISDCEYKCYPDKQIDDSNTKEDTYNEVFIMMNSEKIVQKIRKLFGNKIDGKFFFKKPELIRQINFPKPYPLVQIYAALTQLIEDASEIIMDKYGRAGRLINIGEYYLFQPNELNNKHATIYERSVPLDVKNKEVHFEIKPIVENARVEQLKRAPSTAVAKKEVVEQEEEEEKEKEKEEEDAVEKEKGKREKKEKKKEEARQTEPTQKEPKQKEPTQKEPKQKESKQKEEKEPDIIIEMKEHFQLTLSFARTNKIVERGDDNWYKHCGVSMRKLIKNGIMTTADVLEFLVDHLVDMLVYNEKLQLINYIYQFDVFEENTFEYYVKRYLDKKLIRTKRLTSIILFSGDKIQVMILQNKKWEPAEPEDEREIAIETVSKMDYIKYELNNLIGFIGQDQKNRYLVFKVKDMTAKRNTGARCDEASKTKKVQILIELMGQDLFDTYTGGTTKGLVQPELCSLQELLFRYYNKVKKNNKLWFFDFETAMLSKKELKI
jgi:flagellar biosynthesis GTPase FlhF